MGRTMKTRRLVGLLSLLLLGPVTSEAAVVWFAGAETGSVSEFGASVSGPCTASTAQVRSGAYSLFCQSNNSQIATPTGFNLGTAYKRLYVRYASFGNTGGNHGQLLTARSSANVIQTLLSVNQATQLLQYNYAGGANLATGTIPLALNTWYLIEVKIVNAAGTGGMEVKIDNVVQFSDFTHTTNVTGTIDNFVFGANICCSWDLYYDDILLSSSAYPGPGRSIARQGVAGTPTYDAWTKNSCSGGTIDN